MNPDSVEIMFFDSREIQYFVVLQGLTRVASLADWTPPKVQVAD